MWIHCMDAFIIGWNSSLIQITAWANMDSAQITGSKCQHHPQLCGLGTNTDDKLIKSWIKSLSLTLTKYVSKLWTNKKKYISISVQLSAAWVMWTLVPLIMCDMFQLPKAAWRKKKEEKKKHKARLIKDHFSCGGLHGASHFRIWHIFL